jgi:hypothetical protein
VAVAQGAKADVGFYGSAGLPPPRRAGALVQPAARQCQDETQPTLSEAKAIAPVLGITIDELAVARPTAPRLHRRLLGLLATSTTTTGRTPGRSRAVYVVWGRSAPSNADAAASLGPPRCR